MKNRKKSKKSLMAFGKYLNGQNRKRDLIEKILALVGLGIGGALFIWFFVSVYYPYQGNVAFFETLSTSPMLWYPCEYLIGGCLVVIPFISTAIAEPIIKDFFFESNFLEEPLLKSGTVLRNLYTITTILLILCLIYFCTRQFIYFALQHPGTFKNLPGWVTNLVGFYWVWSVTLIVGIFWTHLYLSILKTFNFRGFDMLE